MRNTASRAAVGPSVLQCGGGDDDRLSEVDPLLASTSPPLCVDFSRGRGGMPAPQGHTPPERGAAGARRQGRGVGSMQGASRALLRWAGRLKGTQAEG
jgi:hypothetical protein